MFLACALAHVQIIVATLIKIELPLVKVEIDGQQVSQAKMPIDLTLSTDIHVDNKFICISIQCLKIKVIQIT